MKNDFDAPAGLNNEKHYLFSLSYTFASLWWKFSLGFRIIALLYTLIWYHIWVLQSLLKILLFFHRSWHHLAENKHDLHPFDRKYSECLAGKRHNSYRMSTLPLGCDHHLLYFVLFPHFVLTGNGLREQGTSSEWSHKFKKKKRKITFTPSPKLVVLEEVLHLFLFNFRSRNSRLEIWISFEFMHF